MRSHSECSEFENRNLVTSIIEIARLFSLEILASGSKLVPWSYTYHMAAVAWNLSPGARMAWYRDLVSSGSK